MSNEQMLLAIYLGWAIIGAGYSAAFIWIVVRLCSGSKWWARWMLAGLFALPVLYLASYGPLAWSSQHFWDRFELLPYPIQLAFSFYIVPLQWSIDQTVSPRWLREGMLWYLGFWG